jgi:hypothetical protein
MTIKESLLTLKPKERTSNCVQSLGMWSCCRNVYFYMICRVYATIGSLVAGPCVEWFGAHPGTILTFRAHPAHPDPAFSLPYLQSARPSISLVNISLSFLINSHFSPFSTHIIKNICLVNSLFLIQLSFFILFYV